MTREARLLSGIILITVPTIQYGGYFLLTALVIVILSLVCQVLADAAVLPSSLVWLVRFGVPLSAILISAGFFFSMLPPTATQPDST
jgi:hypothetical protein